VATRNDLWSAWTRRPAGAALRATGAELARAVREPARAAGVAAALRGLPWALRRRAPVGPRVAAELERLSGP
jgi:hypothetical protein